MTKHQTVFTHLDESDQSKVRLGNGDVVQAKGRGTVQVNTKIGIKTMSEVLFTPELDQNLLSVAQLIKNSYSVSFKNNFCFINDLQGSEIAKVKMIGNSFFINLNSTSEKTLKISEE